MTTAAKPEWQLQEAKNRFSQVIKAAGAGVPQWVTVHGKRAAVLLSVADYAKLKNPPAKRWGHDLLTPDLFTDDEEQELFARNRAPEPHRHLPT
jgi:antitoxin Phd